MKLLENQSFEALSHALSTADCLDGQIDARIESYRLVVRHIKFKFFTSQHSKLIYKSMVGASIGEV